MKKGLYVTIIVICTLLVIAGGVFATLYFTKDKASNPIEDNNKQEVISNEPIYNNNNFPKVDCSTATQPLMMAIASNFTGTEVDMSKFNFTTTHSAYEKLIKNEVDLIVVTEPSTDELQMAKDANIELEVIPVTTEGFVFFVNSKNKVDSLTLDEIQKIYTGEITNWKQVGGDDINIRAYQRPENSGSQTGMLSLVMKGKKMMEPIKENLAGTMSQIVNFVSQYNNENSAIGYSYYYYATTMYKDIDEEVTKNIKFIKVNDIMPNYENIKNKTYPLNTSYYIVINKNSGENSAARKLANELLSPRGQKVIKEAGYVPVK